MQGSYAYYWNFRSSTYKNGVNVFDEEERAVWKQIFENSLTFGKCLTCHLIRMRPLSVTFPAEPKKKVFEQLAKVLPEGSKVSCPLYEKDLRRVLDGVLSLSYI